MAKLHPRYAPSLDEPWPRCTCPVCSGQYGGLVNAGYQCPVCDGAGVLDLGAPALHIYEPPVVARAVQLSLQQHARAAAEQAAEDGAPVGPAKLQALEEAAEGLRFAGVLAPRGSWAGSAYREGALRATTASCAVVADAVLDWDETHGVAS
jgi:hypothetical protein